MAGPADLVGLPDFNAPPPAYGPPAPPAAEPVGVPLPSGPTFNPNAPVIPGVNEAPPPAPAAPAPPPGPGLASRALEVAANPPLAAWRAYQGWRAANTVPPAAAPAGPTPEQAAMQLAPAPQAPPEAGPQFYQGSPGHMAEMSRVGPRVQAEYKHGFNEMEDAIHRNAQAEQEQLVAQQANAYAMQQEQQAQQQGQAAAEAQRQQILSDARARAEQTSNDIANTVIDPNRANVFAGKDMGKKIASSVAIILGGIGQGLLHTSSNVVLDQMQNAINQDVDAQKANYMIAKDKAAAAHTAFGMAMQQFGDERQAEAAARAGLLDGFGLRLKQQALGMQSVAAQNAANDALAKLSMLKAQNLDQTMAYQSVGGGTGHLVGEVKADPKLMIHNPDGSVSLANDEKQAAEINNTRAFVTEINALQDKAQALFAKEGKNIFIPGTAAHKDFLAIQATATPLISNASHQGVVREFELGPTRQSVGLDIGPADYVLGNVPHIINTGRQIVANKANQLANQQANTMRLKPAQVVDPRTGGVETKYYYAGQQQPPGAPTPFPKSTPAAGK